MLILSRRVGDAILVEGGIRIVIIACDRKGVRIGVEAPPDVSILREEIVTQIASENQRANATADLRDLLGVVASRERGTGNREPEREKQGTGNREP
jgi:carbon storage regulator